MIGWRHIVVESVGRGCGRSRKTWLEYVEEDMAKLKFSVMNTHDRAVWRNGILGNRLTVLLRGRMTLNDDNDDGSSIVDFCVFSFGSKYIFTDVISIKQIEQCKKRK